MTAAASEPIACRVHIRPVVGDIALLSLGRIVSRQLHPAILGGNVSVEGYSLFCACPVDRFEFTEDSHPLENLQKTLAGYRLENSSSFSNVMPLPGWIGYFSYDLGRYLECVHNHAKDDLRMPLVHLAFYDAAIIYNHNTRQTHLGVLEYTGQKESVEQKFARLEQWIAQSQEYILELPPRLPRADTSELAFQTNMTQAEYMRSLEWIGRHILDGDVYQINFSQRFECPFRADPATLFLWQNTYNPSPYAAYLATNERAIVSASPELFLQIRGQDILTRPIKGTRPRRLCECGQDAVEFNRRRYEELLHSEKDKAELMMITDLQRNDLARICIPGTRHVRHPRKIEAYPTVFHAYSEVAGTLPRANNPTLFCDILRATFPGGSITGAPKIRAMQLIEELEPTRRGVYTGCIGHIGINFDATLNIAIRTIVIQHGMAYTQTGGGIVADSDPQAEWDETLVKAEALLDCIRAVDKN
ncbi:MAG: anthranilate synthase component I family protein [Sedimentisphaerales bacterium]|nr:anthranilate synthase component I family protein [Sedimentisphaerales bacterium]